MGTRSITQIRSKWETTDVYKDHCVIYRHWDGYLEGHGRYLYNFLKGINLVNGLTPGQKRRVVNGPGRLAAALTHDLHKDGHDPDIIGSVADVGQEFHYVIDVDYGISGGTIKITVFDGPMTAFGLGGDECTNKIFIGTIEDFGRFIGIDITENA